MAVNGLTPYMASNPYLSNVLQAFPSGAAAYSQDLPTILKNFSGQAVPIVSYPTWNPFGDFLNGGATTTGFQGLGFPTQFGGATLAGTGQTALGGGTVNGGTNTSALLQALLGGGTTNTARTTTGTGTNTNQVASLLLSLLGGGNGLLG